jgi:hypothetical protein
MFLTIVGAILFSAAVIASIFVIILKFNDYFSPINRLKRLTDSMDEALPEEENILGSRMVQFFREDLKLTDEQIKEAAEKKMRGEEDWSPLGKNNN